MTHPKKVWHRGTDGGWRLHTMEAVDANHAVRVDPEHWSFEKPNGVLFKPVIEIESSSPVLTEDHLDLERRHGEEEQS